MHIHTPSRFFQPICHSTTSARSRTYATSSHMHLGHPSETRDSVPTHLLIPTAPTYHQIKPMRPEMLSCSLSLPSPYTTETAPWEENLSPGSHWPVPLEQRFLWCLRLYYSHLSTSKHPTISLQHNFTEYLTVPKEAKSTKNTMHKPILTIEVPGTHSER